jgi:hypothetical protein
LQYARKRIRIGAASAGSGLLRPVALKEAPQVVEVRRLPGLRRTRQQQPAGKWQRCRG